MRLHVSDFHFKGNSDWQQDLVMKSLRQHVQKTLSEEGLQPDFICLTGDIAFSGKEAEYKRASLFLRELVNAAGISFKQRLFVIPGNHDLDRDRIGLDADRRDKITEKNSAAGIPPALWRI
ncbi:MAG: metallophosphoesterase family protein [bacterium]